MVGFRVLRARGLDWRGFEFGTFLICFLKQPGIILCMKKVLSFMKRHVFLTAFLLIVLLLQRTCSFYMVKSQKSITTSCNTYTLFKEKSHNFIGVCADHDGICTWGLVGSNIGGILFEGEKIYDIYNNDGDTLGVIVSKKSFDNISKVFGGNSEKTILADNKMQYVYKCAKIRNKEKCDCKKIINEERYDCKCEKIKNNTEPWTTTSIQRVREDKEIWKGKYPFEYKIVSEKIIIEVKK